MSNSKTRIVKVSRGWVPQVQEERYHWVRSWFGLRYQKKVKVWLGVNQLGFTWGEPWAQLRECTAKTEEEAKQHLEAYKKEKARLEERDQDFGYLGEL